MDSGWILVVHPIFVHFAVALTLVALLLDMVGAWQRSENLHWAAKLNLSLGVGGMVLAVASGWLESRLPRSETPFSPQAQGLLEYHEYLGFGLLLFFVLLLVWRWQIRRKPSWVFWVLASLGMLGMVVQGYLGGELVYRYGVRVQAVEFLSGNP